MNIGINTLFLVPNKVGGTEYYTRSFLKYLERLDSKNTYTVFCNKENFDTFSFQGDKWKKVLCPIRAQNKFMRILYEQFILPFKVLNEKCDVLHSYGYFGPILTHSKRIVTVHDANWKDHPDDVTPIEVFVLNVLISINIFLAHKVITDSDFSKKRLAKHYPSAKNKIKVIPGAVDDDFIEELKTVGPPFVKGDYILCVSAFYPHKRIPYLVGLFSNASIENKHLKLVLVGRNGKDEEKVLNMINGNEKIIHFSKVKFTDLVNLYRNAKVFVFPSVYEGFGYPVYEALAAGSPVFVSDKRMYAKQYRDYLIDLSLKEIPDSNLLLKFVTKKKTGVVLFSYQESVSQLIDVYQEISERN